MNTFFQKYRKLFLILGFIVISTLIGFLIFYLFFYSPPVAQPPQIPEDGGEVPVGGLPSSKEGTPIIPGAEIPKDTTVEPLLPQADQVAQGGLTAVKPLTESSATSPSISTDKTGVRMYSQADEKFYRVSSDGLLTPLSNKLFHDVQNTEWSPAKDKAILEYPDGSNIIYDFTQDKQITLPSHWEDFEFSNDGTIVSAKSIGMDVDNRFLISFDENGGSQKILEPLGLNADNVIPAWSPNKQVAALYHEGSGATGKEVFFIGQNNENFKSITIPGYGFTPNWQPDGDTLLYSTYRAESSYKPELWTTSVGLDTMGEGRQSLGVQTWADKCVFTQGEFIYCAVPKALPEGAGMVRDIANNTPDDLYKINITTKAKELVAVPDGDYTMSNLIVDNAENFIYFQNSLDEKMYQIKLK